jgi:hypothetical protein
MAALGTRTVFEGHVQLPQECIRVNVELGEHVNVDESIFVQ